MSANVALQYVQAPYFFNCQDITFASHSCRVEYVRGLPSLV
jgi:hypothetical protein